MFLWPVERPLEVTLPTGGDYWMVLKCTLVLATTRISLRPTQTLTHTLNWFNNVSHLKLQQFHPLLHQTQYHCHSPYFFTKRKNRGGEIFTTRNKNVLFTHVNTTFLLCIFIATGTSLLASLRRFAAWIFFYASLKCVRLFVLYILLCIILPKHYYSTEKN